MNVINRRQLNAIILSTPRRISAFSTLAGMKTINDNHRVRRLQGCMWVILSAVFHEQRWLKETNHEDADDAQQYEASQRDQVVEGFSTNELSPVTHHLQENVGC